MRILSRYFAWRFLGLFAGILFAFTITIVIVEMLVNLDDMLRTNRAATGVLEYLFLRIPSYYLRDLIPIASFAASFFALGLSAHWLEISAAKTGGVSPQRIFIPILAAASLVALGSFALSETWIVNATREWNRQESGGGPSVSYRHGSFWYHRGRIIYNISSADPSSQTLRGVHLYELNDQGRLIRSIRADRVEVGDNHRWLFHTAVIRHFRPEQPGSSPSFEAVDQFSMDVADQGDVATIDTDLQGLGLFKLIDYIDVRLSQGDDVHRVQTALHSRLADPLTALLFALLAIPLGLQVEERRSFGVPALSGVVTIAVFYTVRSVSVTLASEGVISAAVAIWFLVGAVAAAGCLRLTQIRG